MPVSLQHTQPVQPSSLPRNPEDFVYEYLQLASGPTGTSSFDLDTVSSLIAPSVFEYEVPAGKEFSFARINLILVDASISPNDFGGISSGLTNGCLFEIIATDGSTQVKSFTGLLPIKQNSDFTPLAGTDTPITELVGDDQLPIRFSVFKSGAFMKLVAGQRIRWTNRDDLNALTKFRAMVQGILNDA